MPSLLEWAAAPVGPPPLPALDRRRPRRGDWPVALLAHYLTPELDVDSTATDAALVTAATELLDVALYLLGTTWAVGPEAWASLHNFGDGVVYEPPRDEHPDALAYAEALRATAHAVEDSLGLRRQLARAIRAELTAAAPVADPGTLPAFLAAFDGSGVIELTTIRDAYDAAHRPGNLGKHALYRACADRWTRFRSGGRDLIRT